jgi:hypothetical protein
MQRKPVNLGEMVVPIVIQNPDLPQRTKIDYIYERLERLRCQIEKQSISFRSSNGSQNLQDIESSSSDTDDTIDNSSSNTDLPNKFIKAASLIANYCEKLLIENQQQVLQCSTNF